MRTPAPFPEEELVAMGVDPNGIEMHRPAPVAAPRCWCGGATDIVSMDQPRVCLDSVYHDPEATGRPEKVRRLYVAGPMSGYPKNNYPAFNEVASKLRNLGYEVTNPAEYGFGSGRVHYTDLLREDLRLMLECDGVATIDHWWESNGARNEVQVAGLLKMPVRSWIEWTHRTKAELG